MYYVHLISFDGKGSYLSVHGRTHWKTKRTAQKHAIDVMSTKRPLFGAMIAEIEDETGRVLKTYTRKEAEK